MICLSQIQQTENAFKGGVCLLKTIKSNFRDNGLLSTTTTDATIISVRIDAALTQLRAKYNGKHSSVATAETRPKCQIRYV